MFAITVFIILIAGFAFAVYSCLEGRRAASEYGRHMHVRYAGHVALNRQCLSHSTGSGVTPELDTARNSQHEAPLPSALDLLYEQMAEQRWREGCLRREEEHERDY
jgi:hypothetical protein